MELIASTARGSDTIGTWAGKRQEKRSGKMSEVIGEVHWSACDKCKHGDPDGGCLHEEVDFSDLFWVEMDADTVKCKFYEKSE